MIFRAEGEFSRNFTHWNSWLNRKPFQFPFRKTTVQSVGVDALLPQLGNRAKSQHGYGKVIRSCAGIAGFRIDQNTRSSSALIPCQHQFFSHGINIYCLATRNKYHKKYYWWCIFIIDKNYFIIKFQYVMNFIHSHSIVNKALIPSNDVCLELEVNVNTMKNTMISNSLKNSLPWRSDPADWTESWLDQLKGTDTMGLCRPP